MGKLRIIEGDVLYFKYSSDIFPSRYKVEKIFEDGHFVLKCIYDKPPFGKNMTMEIYQRNGHYYEKQLYSPAVTKRIFEESHPNKEDEEKWMKYLEDTLSSWATPEQVKKYKSGEGFYSYARVYLSK